MNHPIMVEKFLKEVMPSFREEQEPETVLLKYARTNNFSPAQLEKMAQIFNTAKSLTFFDKSANRAASFKIVDTPTLLERYQAYDPGEKEEKAATTQVKNNPYAVPFFRDEVLGYKDASKRELTEEVTETSATGFAHRMTEAYKAACAIAQDRDVAEEIGGLIDEIKDEVKGHIKKLASLLDASGVDAWPRIKAHVTREYEEKGATVCCLLENYFEKQRYGLKLEKTAAVLPGKTFAKDPGGWFPVIDEAVALLDALPNAEKAASVFKAAMTAPPPEEEEDALTSIPVEDRLGRRTPRDDDDPLISPEDLELSGVTFMPTPVREVPEKPEKPSEGAPRRTFQDLLNSMGSGSERVTGNVLSGEYIRQLADATHGGKDKDRQKIDQDLEETESAAMLQALMKDEIIGQADPKTVSELYHTLRTANPEDMRNKNLATLTLREALQYGSIPTHTFKELAELRKVRQDTQKQKGEADQKLYAIGTKGKSEGGKA